MKHTEKKLGKKMYQALVTLLVISAVHLLDSSFAFAAENTLRVSVDGIRDAQGVVRVALYNGPEGFPKDGRSIREENIVAQPGKLTLTFKNLPSGRYAAIAYQDEDNNGHLNKRFGMIPIEGYGLSNNPQVFGKPGFDACAFELEGDRQIEISLKY